MDIDLKIAAVNTKPMAIEEIDSDEERQTRLRRKKETLGMDDTLEVLPTRGSEGSDARGSRDPFAHPVETSIACWNQHLEPNCKNAFNTLNDIAVVWHLINCIPWWPQNARTARSLPNPHTSQPDPHVASCHILIVSLSTMQNDWLQQFAPKDVYLGEFKKS